MIDLGLVREEPEALRRALVRRGEDPGVVVELAALDAAWRAALARLESLRADRNQGSKAVAAASTEDRAGLIASMRDLGERISVAESEVAGHEAALRQLALTVPNLPDDAVPDGRDESGNVVVRAWGDPPELGFAPKAHWDLGAELGILDLERGARMSGSRFYVLTGEGARLQRTLIQWMLDFHVGRGYREVYPPFLVKEACMWNAGQLPKFLDNLYHDAEDDLWLVPTAEVPLTNLHAGEILAGGLLPLRYVAYTPCFRREKMSAGRDVRGIKRGHQFDKVEMYKFTAPEDSPTELEAMLADGEAMLQTLGLPYRVVALCTGDLGFGSTRTYDLEVWAAGSREWLEVSSISNFGAFQARRAGIRFRREAGAPTEVPHTLNGSGLALPRTMIAILENGQLAGGGIRLPAAIVDRFGSDRIG